MSTDNNIANSHATSGLIPETPPASATPGSAPAGLPFVQCRTDGSVWVWPAAKPESHVAAQRVEGENLALELLRHYRAHGHDPRARLLPSLLPQAMVPGTKDERFSGFVRILDSMLAFAARHCDLDGYADALDAEHRSTLEAWARLGGDAAGP